MSVFSYISSYWPRSPQCIQGTLVPPADKSISHRALIFAGLANGKSTITNLLRGEDVMRTWRILSALGVSIVEKENSIEVIGQGIHSFQAPREVLYCGNSGTTMRLMMGLLAAQPFESRLTGDDSLNRRPMGRVMTPLRQMGADFAEAVAPEGRIITVKGNPHLRGIHYQSPVASAQIKSAILLAGLYATGPTTVEEPYLSRDHTERFLKSLGAELNIDGKGGTRAMLTPGKPLASFSLDVPADPSSAAFFVVAALLLPNVRLIIENVCLNPTRIAFLDVLKRMGAHITYRDCHSLGQSGGEQIGSLEVESSELVATDIMSEEVPWLIDEIPILSLAFARANGTSRIYGAEELRVKESDRIAAIAKLLNALDVSYQEYPDGLAICGKSDWKGGQIDSHGDHRIAMTGAIAGLLATDGMKVDHADCVATSFPNFIELLHSLGAPIQVNLA